MNAAGARAGRASVATPAPIVARTLRFMRRTVVIDHGCRNLVKQTECVDMFASVVEGRRVMTVPGLTYVSAFADGTMEAELLAAVDAEPWLGDLKRRVQHYGYRYDYTARKIDRSMYLGPLPAWARAVADRLVSDGHMPAVAD